MANFQFWGPNQKFLLIKFNSELVRLWVKNPQFWSKNSKIENLPLIHLLIYKRFLIIGHTNKIFVNKVDFGPVAYLVKVLQFWRVCPHLWIFFITNIKIKLAKVTDQSEAPETMFILLVASEFKMAATAKPAIRGQKYFGWLTYSMVGLIDISFEEIGDFEFGRLFVT